MRRELRRRVRELGRDDEWDLDDGALKELERLEWLHELEGRWIPRPSALVALGAALLVVAFFVTLFPWWGSTAVSLAAITTELEVVPTSRVVVPRIVGVEEIVLTGSLQVRGEDGSWETAESVHLRAREEGRIVVESFAPSPRAPIRWSLGHGEASMSWRPDEGTDPGALRLALRGRIDGPWTASDREDVRQFEIRPVAATARWTLAWRPGEGVPAVELPPFDVEALALRRIDPALEANRSVPGLVDGELVVPARDREPLALGFREDVHLDVEDGRVQGLRSTRDGWQFRFDGRVGDLDVGTSRERDLWPTLFQQGRAIPWLRNTATAIATFFSILVVIWSLVWR